MTSTKVQQPRILKHDASHNPQQPGFLKQGGHRSYGRRRTTAQRIPPPPHEKARPGKTRAGNEAQLRSLRHFFWMYFRQSSVTASRMMMPEKTNWRFVSTPRIVSE